MKDNKKEIIPIFFAVDNGYVPFLAVALQSLVEHVSEKYYYYIRILYTNVSEESKNKIKKYERENVKIEFVPFDKYIKKIQDKLYTRDYFSNATYYRLFIPELYEQYDKALYLDSDIVLLADVAELYNIDMGDNLVAAAPDGVMQTIKVFQDWAEKIVGVASYKNYFNAGVLLMNLDELRKFNFYDKFVYSLDKIKFSVAQDQDYLNRLCKGRVKLIDGVWDKMPVENDNIDMKDLKLRHYNLTYKPWHFDNVQYQDIFWEYAKKTEYYDEIRNIKDNFTDEQREQAKQGHKNMEAMAQKECDCVGDDRKYRR